MAARSARQRTGSAARPTVVCRRRRRCARPAAGCEQRAGYPPLTAWGEQRGEQRAGEADRRATAGAGQAAPGAGAAGSQRAEQFDSASGRR
jgi:hypothetical protein